MELTVEEIILIAIFVFTASSAVMFINEMSIESPVDPLSTYTLLLVFKDIVAQGANGGSYCVPVLANVPPKSIVNITLRPSGSANSLLIEYRVPARAMPKELVNGAFRDYIVGKAAEKGIAASVALRATSRSPLNVSLPGRYNYILVSAVYTEPSVVFEDSTVILNQFSNRFYICVRSDPGSGRAYVSVRKEV